MKDYKDMFGSDKDKRDTNTPFNGRKESTFDLFSINVSKAEKDIKDVFGFAHSQLTDFEKHSMRSTKEITNNYREEYKRLYSDLSSYHIDFLNDLIKREARAADEVRKIWSSVDRNGNNSGNSYTPSGNIFNNNNDNGSNGSSINIDTERISQSTEQAAEQISNSNEKTSKSFSVSATIIKGAAEVLLSGFTKFMDIWIDRFFDGMDRIVDTYEDTYQTVSATMHIDQNQYKQFQNTTLEEIKSLGMENNLAISTVMKELDSVVKLGVTGQEAYNKALADSITKVINPYLEVTSDAYTDLQMKFGTEFVTTMTGIAEATRQSAGSNRFMQRNINDILTSMEPIVLNAKSDYADRTLGPMVQKLEAAVANGTMTMADAENIKQNIVDLQLNPYNALTSDNLGVAMTAQTAASRNVDFKDSSAILDIYAEQMDNLTKDLSTNGTWNQINKGAVYSVYGFNTSMWNNEESFKKVISELDTISSYSSGISRISDFSKDQLNTAKQTKDIWAENQSLALAQFKQTYPDAYEILSTMAATLTKILFSIGGQALGNILSNVGSKVLGKAFGGGATGGSGMSFGNIFGKAAGETAGKGILNGLGSKVTTGLANLGGGSVGAGVATVGGVTAGALLAAQGTYHMIDASKTLSSNKESDYNKERASWQMAGGATGVAGGVVGAGALLTLGASNPIGWVALGIAALGVTVAQVNKSMKKYDGTVNVVNERFNKLKEDVSSNVITTGEKIEASVKNVEDAADNVLKSTEEKDYIDFLKSNGVKLKGNEDLGTLMSMVKDIKNGVSARDVSGETFTNSAIASDYVDMISDNYEKEQAEISSHNKDQLEQLRQKAIDYVSNGEVDKARSLLLSAGLSSDKIETGINYATSNGKDDKDNWFRYEILDPNKEGSLYQLYFGNDKDPNSDDYIAPTYSLEQSNKIFGSLSSKYGLGFKNNVPDLSDSQKEYLGQRAQDISTLINYGILLAENGNDYAKAGMTQEEINNYKHIREYFGKTDEGKAYLAKIDSNVKDESYRNIMKNYGNYVSNGEVIASTPGSSSYIEAYRGMVMPEFVNPYFDDQGFMMNSTKDTDKYGNKNTNGKNFVEELKSHATGISYVPEDETANIHKGEAVLTTAEAREYRQAKATVQSLYDLSLPKISGKSDDNNNDISRSDMLTNINNNIAKIVEAILNLQKSSNSDNMPGPTNDNLLGKINTSYDGNLIGLRSTTTVRQR